MDLVALAHEGVCKPQLKELDLDSWWWEATEGSNRRSQGHSCSITQEADAW